MTGSREMEFAKKLFILQLRERGIGALTFQGLSSWERQLLEARRDRYFLKAEARKAIRVVMTGGAFDVIHLGHVQTLEEAKRYGDVLVVSIASDDLVRGKKGRLLHRQEYRARMVESLKPVDIALLGRPTPQETYEFVRPDTIVYGYDQRPFLQPRGVEIVCLQARLQPEKFKTSRILHELGF